MSKQKITTFLWFDRSAEEAANHYVSIFKNSQILNINRAGELVLTVTFQLEGQQFIALNGGPTFHFTEAISLFVNCETQDEVDDLWMRLAAGGSEGRCGWLKDKFGLSWQIIPSALGELLQSKDPVKAGRAMEAMLQMKKIDIQRLKQASDNS